MIDVAVIEGIKRKFNRLESELDERGVVVGQRTKHSNWDMAELKQWRRQRV